MARVALGCINERKGKNVKALYVAEVSILADYFIIVSAESSRQSAAIADAVLYEFKHRGVLPLGVEGKEEGMWVLIDFGDIVVHVQQQEARVFYDLDNYWGDAPEVHLEPIAPQHLEDQSRRFA